MAARQRTCDIQVERSLPRRLQERGGKNGILQAVRQDEEDGDTLILSFSFPPALPGLTGEYRGEYEAQDLDPSEVKALVGKPVFFAKLLGKHRIGEMSSYFTGPGGAFSYLLRAGEEEPHRAPALAAIEQIRADLPCKHTETDYSDDLPAILAALQEAKGPLKTIEISMLCNLSDEAARRRLAVLVDSGKIEYEKITRIVNKRRYEFPTKRWQIVNQ